VPSEEGAFFALIKELRSPAGNNMAEVVFSAVDAETGIISFSITAAGAGIAATAFAFWPAS
jgi:hypothetical protein